jgi:ABC-type transporter Mla subunit MlaD
MPLVNYLQPREVPMLSEEERKRIEEEEKLRYMTRKRLAFMDTMKRGMLIILVLLLALSIASLLFTANQQFWFRKGIHISVIFDDDPQLKKWAPVKYLGQRIGTVKKIQALFDGKGPPKIEADLFILESEKGLIRTDSKAKAVKPLLGQAFIDIKPGSPLVPAVKEGDALLSPKGQNVFSIPDWLLKLTGQ